MDFLEDRPKQSPDDQVPKHVIESSDWERIRALETKTGKRYKLTREPYSTGGHVYYLEEMSADEIEKIKHNEEIGRRDEEKLPPKGDDDAPSSSPSQESAHKGYDGSEESGRSFHDILESAKTDPKQLFKLKIDVKDLKLIDAGDLSLDIDGETYNWVGGLKFKVDKTGHPTAITYKEFTLTEDGRGIIHTEWHGIDITEAADLGGIFKTMSADLIEMGINSQNVSDNMRIHAEPEE